LIRRNFLYDGGFNKQAWGLIVLLLSKTAGYTQISDLTFDESSGVLQTQKSLAEVTEMIRTSHMVHQSMVNLQNLASSGNELSSDSQVIFGNKIAILGGDYLLGNASFQLAKIG
jgi:decaprenyl-diphosphate synthase subunit 2